MTPEEVLGEIAAEGVAGAADTRVLVYLQIGVLFRRAAEPDYPRLLAPEHSLVYDPARAPREVARSVARVVAKARDREALAADCGR